MIIIIRRRGRTRFLLDVKKRMKRIARNKNIPGILRKTYRCLMVLLRHVREMALLLNVYYAVQHSRLTLAAN